MNLKQFRIDNDLCDDAELVVEADLDILTAERAHEINDFLSNPKDRLADENGDIIRTVVRMFGCTAINTMLRDGGGHFAKRELNVSRIWTEQVHEVEGWGGNGDTPHGWCGIRIASAYQPTPSFDELRVREVP